ncbi:MAG: RidA family protein [candidate division Zixibacteria bacterium]|nr:RidA family protein [candidate division Zixibacteria bacterium]
MKRTLISSGSPYEKPIGFSRAVRVGNIITVAGTGPMTSDGRTASPGDAYGQARRCLEIIKKAIEDAGGRLEHVVRTRILLTDVRHWEEAARAHGEFLGEIRPASTMVGGMVFVRPEWLVEIEADCVVNE